jgi:hypothetical protein
VLREVAIIFGDLIGKLDRTSRATGSLEIGTMMPTLVSLRSGMCQAQP